MAEPMRPDAHATHDVELVAAAAVDDLAGADRDRAVQLVDSCPECSRLQADLRAIASSTRSLGSAFAAGRAPAPRDFRLSADDVKRLGRQPWFSWNEPGLSRPWVGRLGGVLATFGLAGLLLSAAPTALLGTVGSAVTSEQGARDLGAGTRSGSGSGSGPDSSTGSGSVTRSAVPSSGSGSGGDYAAPLAALSSGSVTNASAEPDRAVATPPTVRREDTPIPPDRTQILRAIAILALIGGMALVLATRAGRRAGP